MIGEIAFLLMGAGIGIVLGWILPKARNHHPRPGTTVAEIRARLDRETQGRHCLLT